METASKHFYRHPSDRILGGVAGGLAAYMGWDPTIVRLVALLLIFFQITIPIYIAVWLIAPVAPTASGEPQMCGKADKSRNALQKLGNGIIAALGFLMKALGVLLGVVLISPILLALLILLLVCILLIGLLGGETAVHHIMPFIV